MGRRSYQPTIKGLKRTSGATDEILTTASVTVAGAGAGAGAGALMGAMFGDPGLGAAIGGVVGASLPFSLAMDEVIERFIGVEFRQQRQNFRATESFRQINYRSHIPAKFEFDKPQGLYDLQTACRLVSAFVVLAAVIIDGGATAAFSSAPNFNIDFSSALSTIDPSILQEFVNNVLDKARAGGESFLQGGKTVLQGVSKDLIEFAFQYCDDMSKVSLGAVAGYKMTQTDLFSQFLDKIIELLNKKSTDVSLGAKTSDQKPVSKEDELKNVLPGANTYGYGKKFTSEVLASLQEYCTNIEKFKIKKFADFVAEKIVKELKIKELKIEKFEDLLQPENIEQLEKLKSGSELILCDTRQALNITKLKEEYDKLTKSPSAVTTAISLSPFSSCLGRQR